MTVWALIIGLTVLTGYLIVGARRGRKDTLAGLTSERPSFMVEPPSRSVGKRKLERL